MPDSLLPCPFCGAGTTLIKENGRIWTGQKYGEPSSVSVQHWCDPVEGQPSRMVERVGRDHASAIAAWNRRALSAPAAGEPELPEPDSYCTHSDSHEYEVWSEASVRAYGQAMAEHARRVAPGYVLMPEEMTEAMEDAAHDAAYIWRHTEWRAAERARYAAIRAAAPPQREPK